ncbi:MAG: 16S rRNA (adenine(1518)-N(6)/adenine(1519)-N(6))-dimethyltransferase RsmA [Anaerolineales bacterium]
MDHPLNSSDLNIPKLLKQVGHHPNKRLGQNFLIDPRYLKRVADAGEIIDQDQVLEIGAGVGNLTVLLARKAKQVIAVEIDSSLIPILNQVVKTYPNITIVQGDILELDLLELVGATSYHVVANIPYYITSKLIRKLMTSSAYPQNVILTIQNEVADRICARTGKLSLLGLSVQIFGHPEIKSKIPAAAFYPQPKVDSAIVRIDRHPIPLIPEEHLASFFLVVKAGFSQKRKTLRNSLSAGLRIDKQITENLLQSVRIDAGERAENLTIEQWKKLSLEYEKLRSAVDSDN